MIVQLPIPVRKLNFGLLKDKKTIIRNFIHAVCIIVPATCWFMLLIWLMKRPELLRSDSGGIASFPALAVLLFVIAFTAIYLARSYISFYDRRSGEKELKRMALENEIDMLKAQIQPHFLFNTLNCINATVPPQNEATRELIAQLADTFRYALLSTKEEMVPLKEELGFIRNYLQLEKQRFGDRLSICISEEGTEEVMIAPMLLQPLVENAIMHGIGPAVNGGRVTICCHRKQDHMLISVSDDAIPFNGCLEKLLCGKGVGLKNTAVRIEKIYRQKIRIQKNEANGLTFSFTIPVICQES